MLLFTSSVAIKRSRPMSNRFPVKMLLLNCVILRQRGISSRYDETFEDINVHCRFEDFLRQTWRHCIGRCKILVRSVSKLAATC